MASIKDIQQDIIDEFDMFDEWMGKYEHIIDLGKSLPLIEEAHKTEDNLIKGCQSRVWLHANKQEDKVVYTADSDAIMTKGIIALLVRTFSGQKAQDIVEADTNFINQIGLKEQLSPTRANGLVSMVKQMKLYALAFQSQNCTMKTEAELQAIGEKVVERICQIYDPEIPVNIYELGLIYDIQVSEECDVEIEMTLTSPNCPVAETLPVEVEEKVKVVEEVRNVKVNITFDPPWDKDMMSEEAKLELGML